MSNTTATPSSSSSIHQPQPNVENHNEFLAEVAVTKLNSVNYNNFYQNYPQHYHHHQRQPQHPHHGSEHDHGHYDWRRNCHTPQLSVDKRHHYHGTPSTTIKTECHPAEDDEGFNEKSPF